MRAIIMCVMGDLDFYAVSKKWAEGFIEECYKNGLTEKQAAAALDVAIAKQYGETE